MGLVKHLFMFTGVKLYQ